ncbi:SET and MYND domain-containing protein 5 [Venturia canescens]|uniref:SET and MYND domain-containing protein 5 n=1 Tax=Venturia canescens TaxID=32260 RepID=UPI001C9BC6AC|nr:SET and MYND domain-containing protein 5 [Venturia canescens]
MEVERYEVRIIDEVKGKGLFARHNIKEGEQILVEKPILCCQFAWSTDYGYLSCDNCMRPLETAEENVRRLTGKTNIILPYPQCCETQKETIVECQACGIKYCCKECLDEANAKYHKTLCLGSRDANESHPLTQLKETWKRIYYPPETATIMLLARMVAYVNQSTDKSVALATFAQFCHKTVNEIEEIAHNLMGEKFVTEIDVLRYSMQNALNSEFTTNWFTPDGFRSLLALVGTNGQGIGTSAFGRWAKNVSALELPEDERIRIDKHVDQLYDDMDEVVGTYLNNEGSGLYALQSTINHSCSPNANVEFPFSNSTLVVTATKDISAGEEICIGYLDECELERSRHSRQKALSSLYLFNCRCDKCVAQADDPDCTSDEEPFEDADSEPMSD